MTHTGPEHVKHVRHTTEGAAGLAYICRLDDHGQVFIEKESAVLRSPTREHKTDMAKNCNAHR